MTIHPNAERPVRPSRGITRLERRLDLPEPIERVFPFFTDAFNLERITPPFLRFQVLTPPPIRMQAGVRIDYRIRLRGIPLRWQSEITVWEPPHRFIDLQIVGPYRWWHHEHRFESTEQGTRVIDEVEYAVPGGRLVAALFVRRDLNRIFDDRRQRLLEVFAPAAAMQNSV